MIITLLLSAVLCAVILLWVLAPINNARQFYALAFAAALFSLGLYLAYGRPDLPAAPVQVGKGAEADYRQMMLDEFTMMDRLSKNPDDADAMIRLAMLRLAQGRGGEETLRLLARAEKLAPKDKRLTKIKQLLEK
ncbi:MAG: hypothetical protein KGQ41_01620 [Alphaproteobacteria bacterium]|nr:hypothetical protein [Alphaproteobacteria bacterium]